MGLVSLRRANRRFLRSSSASTAPRNMKGAGLDWRLSASLFSGWVERSVWNLNLAREAFSGSSYQRRPCQRQTDAATRSSSRCFLCRATTHIDRMKTKTSISVSLATAIITICIVGCSDASHSKLFLAALQQTQASYQATAGAEHPGHIKCPADTGPRRRKRDGSNESARRTYAERLQEPNRSICCSRLGEASRHFQE